MFFFPAFKEFESNYAQPPGQEEEIILTEERTVEFHRFFYFFLNSIF